MAPKSEPKVEGIFDRDFQERKISRILDKAVRKRVSQATRNSGTVGEIKVPKFAAGKGLRAQKKGLGDALVKAMSARIGRPKKDAAPAPSMRKSAPDTGGRSFHFEAYSVSKQDAAQTSHGGAKAGGRKGTGSAHQRYIEREIAVEAILAPNEIDAERTLEPAIDAPRKRGRPSKAVLAERAARQAGGVERDPIDRSAGAAAIGAKGAARSGQAYVEDPAKLVDGGFGLSSFGNIGKTYDERLRFWELVEEHEPHQDARVQNRIIVELPHQSTPKARREIMERFVAPLAEKGLPFYVAIHAPGEKNDSRNFHAHLVYIERPAKQMIHPETGELVWDFTVSKAYKTSSRNTKYTYPYRQKRDRELKEWDAVPKLRKHFAEIVTDVMAAIDPSVKFDARSYKAMGLTTTPLATVHRVLHDRMRDGALVLMNPDWSKRMIAAEVDAAAQRKDPQVMRLLELTEQLEGLRDAWPNVKAVNDRLAPTSRLPGLAGFTKRIFRRTIDDRIRLEAEIVKERVVAKAEVAVCRRVLKATEPFKEGIVTVHRKAPRTPEEQQELDLIRDAAAEELAAAQARLKSAEAEAKRRLKANAKAFQDAGHGRNGADAPTAALTDEGRRKAPQAGLQAAKATAAQEDAPARPRAPVDLSVNPFVPFLPEYAEAAERRRKRRQAEAARGSAPGEPDVATGTARSRGKPKTAETAQQQRPPTEQAAGKSKAMPTLATAAARAVPAYEDTEEERNAAEAQRKEARERAQAEFLIKLNAQMATMYDPQLRGQAFADSLKAELDLYYPERNGVHGPGADELALQTEAFARSEYAPAAVTPGQGEGASPSPTSEAKAPEAPAPRQAEAVPPTREPAQPLDLSTLPKPVHRNPGPIRIRKGTHRPMFEVPGDAPPAAVIATKYAQTAPEQSGAGASAVAPPNATAPQRELGTIAPPTKPRSQRPAAPPTSQAATPMSRRSTPQAPILEEFSVIDLLDPTRRQERPPTPSVRPQPEATVASKRAAGVAVARPEAASSAPSSDWPGRSVQTTEQPNSGTSAAQPASPTLAREALVRSSAETPPGQSAEGPVEAPSICANEARRKKMAKRRKAIMSRKPSSRGGRGG